MKVAATGTLLRHEPSTVGIGTIIASLALQLAGNKNWADFVGKWPPTFFAIGLYHKLVRPGQENGAAAMATIVGEMQDGARKQGLSSSTS